MTTHTLVERLEARDVGQRYSAHRDRRLIGYTDDAGLGTQFKLTDRIGEDALPLDPPNTVKLRLWGEFPELRPDYIALWNVGKYEQRFLTFRARKYSPPDTDRGG